MKTVRHSHKCADCGEKTPCDGELMDNYDGWPEIICLAYHLGASCETNPDFICEGCDWKRADACLAAVAE